MNQQAIVVNQHLIPSAPSNDVLLTSADVAWSVIRGMNEAMIQRLSIWNGVKGNAIEKALHGAVANGVQALADLLDLPGIVSVVPDTNRKECVIQALATGTKAVDVVSRVNGRITDLYFDKFMMNNVNQNRWNYDCDLTHTLGVMAKTHPGVNVTLCNLKPLACPYFEGGKNGRLVRLEHPMGLGDEGVQFLQDTAEMWNASVAVHDIFYAYHPALLNVTGREQQRAVAKLLIEQGESLIDRPETMVAPLQAMIEGMVSRLIQAASQMQLPFAA